MKNLIFQYAEKNHIEDIVNIIRDGNNKYIDKIIYGYKGIYKYIEECILDKHLGVYYFVALKNNEVVGAIELKEVDGDTIFLNYIAVSEHMRGKGIGKFMLSQITTNYKSFISKYTYIGLDVFNDNLNAYNWYKKLGFKVSEVYNWSILQTRLEDELSFKEEDCLYTNAYKNNGFDILTLDVNDTQYKVGILGNNWFRINQDDIDEDLIRYLSKFNNRKVFSIINKNKSKSISNIDESILKSSYRMKCKIKNLEL